MRKTSLALIAALVALLLPQTRVAAAPAQAYSAPETGWTSVFREYPTTAYWNGQNLGADRRAPVGFSGALGGTPVTARSYFGFDTSALHGKRVLGAEFVVHNSHAASCAPARLTLVAAGPVTPSTTWNTQPASRPLQERFAPGGGERCGGTVPVGFDVTGYVAELAASGAATATFGLTGPETDQWAWRKFDTSASGTRPQLTVVYE